MEWGLTNGNIILPNDNILRGGRITILDNLIKDITERKNNLIDMDINIEGLWVLPGFINSHDHLLGTYLPRVGDRKPYLNWLMWDNDLKNSPVYVERQNVSSQDLYQLGAYRNLICGITSVQDHIPHFVREQFAGTLPVRLVDKYALAHSICSFALPWGDGVIQEHRKAQQNNLPFITHCSEGFDEETKKAVQVLKKQNALTKNTVLVHGIAFSEEDIYNIEQAKTSVVWCAFSNLYMFEKTTSIRELLKSNVNVLLGTDSPMSGSTNLFQEIETEKKFYRKAYKEELDNHIIYKMLTENPAKAFFLEDLGSLKVNNLADIIVVKGEFKSQYDVIEDLNYENIMLVVVDGIPRFGDKSFKGLFEKLNVPYQDIVINNSHKIIYGDILGVLERIKKAVGYDKKFEFCPIEPIT